MMDQMALVESCGGFSDEVARSPVWPARLWITLKVSLKQHQTAAEFGNRFTVNQRCHVNNKSSLQ